jgi:hypothetical protein
MSEEPTTHDLVELGHRAWLRAALAAVGLEE